MAGEKEIGSFFGQDGIVYEERARKDLPIPGWRLHIIKSKLGVLEPKRKKKDLIGCIRTGMVFRHSGRGERG
jgi:hypothetical protein